MDSIETVWHIVYVPESRRVSSYEISHMGIFFTIRGSLTKDDNGNCTHLVISDPKIGNEFAFMPPIFEQFRLPFTRSYVEVPVDLIYTFLIS